MSSQEYKLIFHPEAEADYGHAYYWYELQKEGLGESFIEQFRKRIEQILENPETYSTKSKKDYREARLKDFPYVIVYKIQQIEKNILISSIHHQSKHPKKKFRK